jgi:ribosomal protein S18 acetylase RimI-like enzyme
MLIRQLSETDVSDWRTIRLEAVKLHPESFGSSFEEENSKSDNEFAEGLRRNIVFASYDGVKIAGCVGFFVFSELKTQHRGTMFGMYVRQEFRRSGLSNRLVTAVLDHAPSRVVQVHCRVVTSNVPALKLYESNGFEIYGTEPRSLKVGPTFYDEHLMVKRFDTP